MAYQHTIFLASRTEQEATTLESKLEPVMQTLERAFGPLAFVSAHPKSLLVSPEVQTASAVVLNFTDWNPADRRLVEDLVRVAPATSLIVLAKREASRAVLALGRGEQIVFVEKPFENHNLTGILRKLLTVSGVTQQVHRRFNTDEDAEVELKDQKLQLPSRLFNLSKGGAYLEFIEPAPLKVGDNVSLKLSLKQVNRTYTMPAKVVWVKGSTPSGGIGIGVEFTGPGSVQRSRDSSL